METKLASAEPDYRARVAVRLEKDVEEVRVHIEDNGIGLPQDGARITEPYVTTREKGTGLGLAIVNKIVEEHGGGMTFATTSHGGTRVTLTFARAPVPSDPDHP